MSRVKLTVDEHGRIVRVEIDGHIISDMRRAKLEFTNIGSPVITMEIAVTTTEDLEIYKVDKL